MAERAQWRWPALITGWLVLLAWAYSAPPLKTDEPGLGELSVAAARWLVVVGADYVQRQHWHFITAHTAVSFALLVANILLMWSARCPVRPRRGQRPWPRASEPTRAGGLYTGLMLAAHLWLAMGVWALIPPLSAIWGCCRCRWALVASVLLWLRAGELQRLRPVLALTIATASLHGLAMAAGLLSMRWTG